MKRYTTEDLYPGKLARQPQWVQRRIADLERQIEMLDAKLSMGPEGSLAWADPHSRSPRPLGKRPVVLFGDPDGEHFDVQYKDGALIIHGTSGSIEDVFVVAPRAANAVVISHAPASIPN